MYELLDINIYAQHTGNDPELDPNREPEPPVQVVDKSAPRRGKRDGPSEPRDTVPPPRGNRGPRLPGNEQARPHPNLPALSTLSISIYRTLLSNKVILGISAFRDRNAGSQNNRNRPTDAPSDRAPPAAHRNRDTRGYNIRDDRQSRTDRTITEKQVEQGWGSRSGESALKDERAGEDIARSEEKEAAEANAEEPVEEPEDKSKSYADYLAEQAQAKLELAAKESRKANEGAKMDKKWAAAKELKRDDEEDEYIKGQSKETRRERQRKEKNVLEVDMRFVEVPRRGGDSSRGRGRGGDRGGDRGRGGRGGRGDFRGGRGNGRGAPRGGPSHATGPTVDEKNFPSLGGK
ncbi:telomere and ribosome associated protein Stm1, putative [Trichophyton benhamiae CBS 112371]|uniref:Telomere and ribosome associated protein Stm1, putative n=1 Tax=Arthroderma benhamiae (strain ATCC MYA-4681 / CBS 112371) TaxID=663331 RepID=D4AMS9_ARTBC|nr:telomere and ribosome associated protein Stm1, putative [Trichophyton benhamiae CBS 112371]EFE35490.1 telomere and ribosome associated protein Stm1, putative [Trichophyton benhamiae CBS 112371]